MATTMADRLAEQRRRAFVGRADQLELFAQILTAAASPVAVLFVHGPAGVGKTTLLHRYAELAESAGVPHVLLDARELSPTPQELAQQLPVLLDHLGAGRSVLLVDTFELLSDVEHIVRDQVLPGLPAQCLVVLAGQQPPASAWLTDPGWAALLRTVPLQNFSVQESRNYLQLKHIATERFEDALTFTRGHPLALALISEVLQRHGTFSAKDSPDVIKTLVDRLVHVVPSPAHRRALEAAAQVRVVTEPLLAALLEPADDAADLFAWLRRLTLVDARPSGLYIHDLARDVLAADLQWRDPQLHAVLHDRARAHYLARLQDDDHASQAEALMDLMFLHPALRRFLLTSDSSGLYAVPADLAGGPDSGDGPGIQDMVSSHEGAESGALARRWLERQPGAWVVVRTASGEVAGAMCTLSLTEASPDDAAADPAVRAALAELGRHPPLRPGERATLCRYWLSRQEYQAVSPVQSLIAVLLGRYWLTTPGLALTLLPFAEPDAWTDFAAYADQHRLPTADFAVGGRTYGVFGHDWRVVSPTDWLAGLAIRETGRAQPPPSASQPRLLVLDRDQFASEVRRALKDINRPDRLRDNALLRSRIVASKTAATASVRDQVEALQSLVREAVATMQEAPATLDRRAYRLLHRAYLAPAATLENAAAALNLPSSTFRRHLTQAVARVTELLWETELGT